MEMTRGRRRFLALGFAAVAAVLMSVSPTLAASPVVGAPNASVKFLSAVTFTGTATLTSDVARVELVLDLEGSTRSVVADVNVALKPGPADLSYVLESPSGALVPGTAISASFRLVLKDGSTVAGPVTTVHYTDTRYLWQTVSGEFVRVYYTEGGAAFGRRAATIGDDAIRQVSALLGVTETAPIKFYIYADRTAFYDVLGPAARENVGGEAHPEIRTLFANIGPDAINDPWVGVVIPHELTHLVFDTAVKNPYHYPPRWLNEGIAVYLSESYGNSDRSAMADAARKGTLMPLEALTGEFPTARDGFLLAYSESVSAVSFLVDHYGRGAMAALARAYAGGVTDDEAFKAALGTGLVGFEDAWLKANGATVLPPYGPENAPAGPAPSDWAGAPLRPGMIPAERSSISPAGTNDDGTGNGDRDTTGLIPGILAVIVVGVAGGLLARRLRRARS
jgi:hypothetical protein